jgi:hypothetical protein
MSYNAIDVKTMPVTWRIIKKYFRLIKRNSNSSTFVEKLTSYSASVVVVNARIDF